MTGEERIASSPDQSLDLVERVRLMREGLVNYSGVFVSAIVGIVLVPVMISGLGRELYGLWLLAASVSAVLAVLTFGLNWSVTREVAGAINDEARERTARFVRAVGNAYFLIGALGLAAMSALGFLLVSSVHLSGGHRHLAPLVFSLAGVSFAGDQLLLLAIAVLSGQRRFGTSNLLGIASASMRAAGIILLLKAGAGLGEVVAWQAALSTLVAFAALITVARIDPQLRLLPGRPEWRALRPHLPFGVMSFLTIAAGAVIWQVPRLLIGVAQGTAAIVPYHVGQRMPLAISDVASSSAQVLYPAASRYERAEDSASARETFEVGTRWIVVLVLPLSLALGILAPNLVHAWVGQVPAVTVDVLRLTVAAVFAEALSESAQHVLWGFGAARKVLRVLLGVAGGSFALTVPFVLWFGVLGAAWGLFIPMAIGSLAFVRLALQTFGLGALDVVRRVSRGLFLPSAACVATLFVTAEFATPQGWLGVLGAMAAGGVVYATTLYAFGARDEERALVREAVAVPMALARLTYRRMRPAPPSCDQSPKARDAP